MRVALLLLTALLPAAAWAGKKHPPPDLSQEHVHASGAFSVRTPESWVLRSSSPEMLEVWGQGMGVRFVFRGEEAGYDSLHATCMLERLAGPMETEPQVAYEYDFVEGPFADRRLLDSAFSVSYDRPVRGHRQWRQRNVTIVGAGESLCVVAYAPLPLWRRSSQARAVMNAVLGSVTFH